MSTLLANRPLDAEKLREDFPIFREKIYGKPLTFLDSGASAQKPQAVIDAISRCYSAEYANVHRGVYYLSQLATEHYEGVRAKIRAFINAAEDREIIYLRGATEAINLVANSWGRANLKAGDEIILSAMEHHSNIVPWQMICQATGAVIRVAPIDAAGNFRLDEFETLLSPRAKLVAITHVSNALGSIVPLADVIRLAHKAGAKVLVDGCQAIPHLAVDVRALDADFYVFSGHKIYGPSGAGILYGKAALLEAMPPWQGGGDMIASVTFEKTTYTGLPHKFEAGTPAIADVIGLGAAIDYVQAIGMEAIAAHDRQLLNYATPRLAEIPGLTIVGQAADKTGIISFTMAEAHPHDIGTILDRQGIAIRAGHHCAQPVMDFFGVPATARASFGLYNTTADIDALVSGLHRVREIFG